jgi:matrixin
VVAPRNTLLLLAAALALLVGADALRRSAAHGSAQPPAPVRERATVLPAHPAVRASAEADAERRSAVLGRLATEGADTYLPAIVSADSLLRRWPDARVTQPLRVATVRADVPGYREEFAGNVNWSITRWNGVLPVQLTAWTDTATADILVTWTELLDSNRTGRTDLTWDDLGWIHHAVVVLATHLPDGREMDGPDMTAVALHELGHAIGLDHSPDSSDALYPRTRAIELSGRDRRSAQLLYRLPPGSLR